MGIPLFAVATALAGASSDVPIGVFKGPQLENAQQSYPEGARRYQRQGWVILGFMVSSKGTPYAVTVLDSSGARDLEKAAVKNLENSTFVPASLDGKPIDAGAELQFNFVLTGLPRGLMRTGFYSNYTDLLHAIENRDVKSADWHLKAFVPENLTEDALNAIGRARYAAVWGTPSEELSALERAEDDNHALPSLPPDLVRSLRLIKLELDINLHHYVEALGTWDQLKPSSLPPDVRARLAPAIEQIEHIRDAHLGYSLTGELDATGWRLHLLEPQFSIVVSQGKISEVRLRCQGGYLYFPFDPQLQYTVNGSYRNCGIELVGDPGTRFTLNQF